MGVQETRASNGQARNDSESTDFTFTCQGRDIRVHKIIICINSLGITFITTNDHQEALSGTYDLTSDESDMVQLMVDYLYTGDYSLETGEADEEPETYGDSSLSIHAIMYSIGDKYDIEGLRHLSTKKYCEVLKGDLYINDFFSSIPYVYDLTPETSRDLRDPALAFARNVLSGDGPTTLSIVREAFDELVIECPEFVKELLYSALQSPLLGYCECSGPRNMVPVEAEQYRCRECGKGGASLGRP
ncbi:hypothetical protein HG530_010907 [Fusarium avenaceum]|nr:hypothetical protein HG530_010907 [Fusarium avenaceum]